MSQDLDVHFIESISVGELIELTNRELARLLCINDEFSIIVQEVDKGITTSVDKNCLVDPKSDGMFLVKLINTDNLVSVNCMQTLRNGICDLYASISVWSNEPLDYCLAAAVALALAKHFQSNIVDGGLFWVDQEEIDVNEFFKRLSVKHKGLSFEEAVQECWQAFYVHTRYPDEE